ncbi:FAD-dependent oxidoreductase [Nocardia sp. CA-107356]|uniref:FAD-dependent oxidoreductase n=1 Tax=Nocardia sp. CA-107356 TaxID=3239972 RepID=UPI003D8BE008
MEEFHDHVVVGGGFAGLHCTAKLAEAGFGITVFEERPELMAGSSRHNFARLHHGWHYPGSLETAEECLPPAFDFLVEFGHTLLPAPPNSAGGPLRNGWVALATSSFTSREQWMANAEHLIECYRAERELRRASFGPTEEFFRRLPKSEWRTSFNECLISDMASTLEPFIDLSVLAGTVIERLRRYQNIQVRTNHRVVAVDASGSGDYPVRLTVVAGKEARRIHARRVINASWLSRAMLDRQIAESAGLPPPDDLTYRLKTFVRIELPSDCRDLPSLLVVHGAFVSFTNFGDGSGLVDYAPVSNERPSVGRIPDHWYSALAQRWPEKQCQELIRATMQGVIAYVPALANARPISLHASALYHPGTAADVFDPTSAAHHRLGTGVTALTPHWFSLDTGKLSWVPRHVATVARAVTGFREQLLESVDSVDDREGARSREAPDLISPACRY